MSSVPSASQTRRTSSDAKKTTPTSNIVTRSGAKMSKVQTRAMSSSSNPAKASASVMLAKKRTQQKKQKPIDSVLKDPYHIAMSSKSKVKGATGFVTEPRMCEHRCLWDKNYPECPQRLISVINRCKELNLLSECIEYASRAAVKEELLSLHAPLVFEMMEETHLNHDIEYLEALSSKYDAIYIHPTTHELALIAAGSTIDMVERIVKHEVQNGAAFIRPPGHHAMRDEPCGYCFYNNVALAAKHAIDKLGVTRILIVDWDVHHGQATQQMFYDDPRVVYLSVHRYEHGAFWPNLRQSNFNYVGSGAGRGYTFNVPLNVTGCGDADYLAIWHQLLLPMAFEVSRTHALIYVLTILLCVCGWPFKPELILISAGYDAALGCPEGEMVVTPSCYATLLQLLMSVCSQICVVLEGGYCLQSLAEGAALTLRTLLGYPPPKPFKPDEIKPQVQEAILNCIYAHRSYWKCYTFQESYSIDTSIPNVCDAERDKHTVEVKWEGDENRPETFETRLCYPIQSDETKRVVSEKLHKLRILTSLVNPQYPVSYVFDTAMLKHRNVSEPHHIECPERIIRIHERLRDFGLLTRLHQIPARAATDEEILTVHSDKHLNMLKELTSMKTKDISAMSNSYESVYFHPDSLESASMAYGSVIEAVESVMCGDSGSCVCIVRPPGHHAARDVPEGFCLLNNVVGGATLARDHHHARVLLLDWDVHHGDGTQDATYYDPQILYISIHRYDNGTFFPHSTNANYIMVGEGKGRGFNVNIPWNKRGMGDIEYMAAFNHIVMPIAHEFNPDLVMVSAGFDACIGDPLGGCKVSPECYGRMTQMLRSLAGGRVILCLEGGYNVGSVSFAMTMCVKALLGDPIQYTQQPFRAACNPSAVESIKDVIRTHKKYWKNLKFHVALPVENVLPEPMLSRGLTVTAEPVANSSLSTSLDDSNKSVEPHSHSTSSADTSLEKQMEKLTLTTKCTDGVHCGSDDESKASKKKSKKHKRSNSISETPVKPATPLTPEEKRHQEIILGESFKQTATGGSKDCVELNITGWKDVDKAETAGEKPVSSGIGENKPGASEAGGSGPGTSKSNEPKGENQLLVDYLAENIHALANGEMFAVIPLPGCPHLDGLPQIPTDVKFEQGQKCIACDETVENWVCLQCFVTACARGINGHMQDHFRTTEHPLVLSLVDLSVWCNVCDAYVDNPKLYEAKNNAHRCKFGENMPWTYKK